MPFTKTYIDSLDTSRVISYEEAKRLLTSSLDSKSSDLLQEEIPSCLVGRVEDYTDDMSILGGDLPLTEYFLITYKNNRVKPRVEILLDGQVREDIYQVLDLALVVLEDKAFEITTCYFIKLTEDIDKVIL